MSEDTAFPDELSRRLRDADPARALTNHPEPWRLRESIIMSDLPVSDPSPDAGAATPTWRTVKPWRIAVPVLVAGLAAVLVVVPGQGSQLPVIRIGAGVNAAPAMAEADTLGGKLMMPYHPVEYRFDASAIVKMPNKATVYKTRPVNAAGLKAFAADAAAALGGLAPVPASPGASAPDTAAAGTLVFGSADWTGPRFEVSSNGQWSYGANSTTWSSFDPCAAQPAPLPDEQVLAAASAFLTSIGVSTDGLRVEYSDGFSATATAPVLVDRIDAGMATFVSLDSNGDVTYASGSIGSFDAVGDYPLAGLDDAVARLGSGFAQIMMSARSPMTGAADSAAAGTPETAPAVVSTIPVIGAVVTDPGFEAATPAGSGAAVEPMPAPVCDPTVGGGSAGSTGTINTPVEPMPVDPGLTPEPAPMPVDEPVAPAEPTEPEIVAVTLVSVEVTYTQLWDIDGVVWLVPQFMFTDSNGNPWYAMALGDQFLDEVMPPVAVDPVPVLGQPGMAFPGEPGAGAIEPGTAEPDPIADIDAAAELAARLIGLSETEATKVADGAGFAVRVVARDGEFFAVTQDFRPDRINIAVVDGTVTDAYAG